MASNQATDVEKIAWYAQLWRQADKEAIADRRNVQKQRAEYRARGRLREAIDMAIRRAARVAAAAPGRFAWRGHVTRLACGSNAYRQRVQYRARRRLHRAVDGSMRTTGWPVLSAPARPRCEMPRAPLRRVIIS